MAQRFKSSGTGQAISVAGLTIPHGLGTTPDEVWAVITALGNVATANSCYMFSAADATNVYFASGSAACSAVVYAATNHSIVK